MRFYFSIFLLFISARLFSITTDSGINYYNYENDSIIQSDTLNKTDYFIINKIDISGNKKTKPYIITRELQFHQSDTVFKCNISKLLKQSQENIFNTSLFNFVTIDTNIISINLIDINIDVIERWYLWPFPVFEFADRNFNSWLKDSDFSKLNYGLFLNQENFRGRNETLKLLLRFGYEQRYAVFYEAPYINKKQTLGIAIDAGYAQSHEVPVSTINDTLHFFKDENIYPKKVFFSGFSLIHRKSIYNTHYLSLSFSDYKFADTLLKISQDYSFQNQTEVKFLSLIYKYKSDFRDYKHYPLNGYYFDVEVTKTGLGLFDRIDLFSLQSTFRKFWKLSNRFYYASGLTAKFSSIAFQPYFIQRGLGYERDFVRGYEYYVIDGQSFGLLKTNLKYELLSKKVTTINFIKTQKFNKIYYSFYLNLFTDLAFVEDNQFFKNNSLSNELLVGYGVGLDFVTYYDVVVRLELSINRLGEKGVFIHFQAPI
jgi:outer membrane protein assembly factor BamA